MTNTQPRPILALRLSHEQKKQVKEATGQDLDCIDLINPEGCLKVAPAVYRPELNGHAPKDLYGMILDQVEPPLLKATLKYCEGNQSRAAAILGLNRATLRKKIRQHKIQTTASR